MKNYTKVDHANRRIIMDRTFAKNAAIVGSREYNLLQACRRDYPEYTVVRREIKKRPNQERYNGLSYKFMEDYIRSHETAETVHAILDEFEEMKLVSKGHSRAFRYPTIKHWFLQQYPEFVQFGMPPAVDHEAKVFDVMDSKSAGASKKIPA